MDPTVGRGAELLSLDPRLNGCKPHHSDMGHGPPDLPDTQEMLDAQYINLQRLPDNLSKVQLDGLSNDLLGQQVVEMQQAGGVGYYGEDLLTNDLAEEEKRLAAALVAVQLVHQQKHSNLLGGELMGSKSVAPLSPFNSGTSEKPGMAAVVTSYIQALEEEAANHMLETRAPPPPRTSSSPLHLPPLPPLKKVLTTQNFLRTRPKKDAIDEHLRSDIPDRIIVEDNKMFKSDDADTSLEDHCLDDIESDYEIDGESKPCRKSLPHKKRIPRKLKTQPQRNIHSKCYKCQKCGDSFSNQTSFFSHRSQHNVPPKRTVGFSCEICGFQSTDQMRFFEHLKTHYEPKNAVETVIQTDFQDFDTDRIGDNDFGSKSDDTERNGVALSCELCGKMFRRRRSYEAHKATVHPVNIATMTSEEFSEPEDMMEGIRHVVDMETSCPDDDNLDRTPRAAWPNLDHPRSSSSIGVERCRTEMPVDVSDSREKSDESKKKAKKKELPCPHCPRVFFCRASLIYHIRSHTGRRPHQCEVCGKSFFTNNALKVHMRLHSGDKPYKCNVCGRCFRQWGDLKYHTASLHSTKKQYQCEFCGKDFARKYSLVIHRRIHTNEKNYVCDFCSKSFRASSYLLHHRRIHTGEKPHACDICGKAFRVKSDMKRHRAIHGKELRGQVMNQSPVLIVPDVRVAQSEDSLVTDVDTNDGTERTEPECLLSDVSAAPLNLMRSDPGDPLTYRESITLDRDQNTLYVWLPATTADFPPD